MEDKFEKALENVLKRAAAHSDSSDIMRYSQAAANLVHAKANWMQNEDIAKRREDK